MKSVTEQERREFIREMKERHRRDLERMEREKVEIAELHERVEKARRLLAQMR